MAQSHRAAAHSVVRNGPICLLLPVKRKVTWNVLVILPTIVCLGTHAEGLLAGLSPCSALYRNLIPLSKRQSDDTKSALLGFGSKFTLLESMRYGIDNVQRVLTATLLVESKLKQSLIWDVIPGNFRSHPMAKIHANIILSSLSRSFKR